MSTTIPVTFSRSATYTEELRAEVDAHEYADWCEENGHDSLDLEALKVYILNEYDGDFEEGEPMYEDSEFRDFDNAKYAKKLTAAAKKPRLRARPEAELHEIALREVSQYGRHGRPMYQIAADEELTEEDRGRVLTLIQGARFTVSL